MSQNIFNSMELDAIGELMNISLGSSATAVSNMLDHRVDITTPTVEVVTVENFSLGDLEPAIGIEIKYVSGLEGSNIMLLKRGDVKVIVDILMGCETPDEEFELNELTVSAVCEVMNQMMGAASTALSDFLGYSVNISTPQSFALDDLETFKKEHFPPSDGNLVVVRFMLGIENVLKSEFVNVMSVELARDLLAGFEMNFGSPTEEAPAPAPEPAPAPTPQSAPAASGGGATLSQEEIERLMGGGAASAPAPAPTPQPAPAASGGGATLSQEEIERLMGGGAAAQQPVQQPVMQQPVMQQPVMQQPVMQQPAMQQPMMQQPMMQQEPRLITARQAQLPALDVEDRLGKEQADNLEMIMSVPLEISVEIGRTRRKVEDILSFTKGSLVVLDKLAGDQVDLFVNGLCVAKGDVVVIDDNFGVRITEVLKHGELLQMS